MIVRNVPVMSIIDIDSNIYAVIKGGTKNLSIVAFNDQLSLVRELAILPDSNAYILRCVEDRLLISADNRLVLFEGGESRVVLETRPGNFFWHAVEVGGRVFVQEYGESPTGIYVSGDLMHWVRVVDNERVDASSRHFHFIGYDPYRGWLITTLGDGNVVRVAYSPDLGGTWRPLYVGPWQFVPFVVRGDRVVFGFDSGFARGGVGIYYPADGEWEFRFFRPVVGVRYMQFSGLLFVDELGVYVAAFGAPQVIAVSRDLTHWYPLYVEDVSEEFNHHVGLLRVGDEIVWWTGSSVGLVAINELDRAFDSRPITMPYNAYFDRFKGLLFMAKRRLVEL